VDGSEARPTTETEALVEALETQLHRVDLVGWAQITMRAEEIGLTFGDLRLLLAMMSSDGPTSVGDLAQLSGFSLDAAYPAVQHLRGLGYLQEERRRYTLSEAGHELVGLLEAAHREGIRAYVDGLDDGKRQWLAETVRMLP
jgi:hypothetical protein